MTIGDTGQDVHRNCTKTKDNLSGSLGSVRLRN